MNPAEEFRRHANECRRMALDTRDLRSKATWSEMADRWIRCAELAEAQAEQERRLTKYRHAVSPIFRKAS
jgi:hypothetical protein